MNNKNSERRSKVISFIVEKIPGVLLTIVVIWLFFYLMGIKSKEGIQAVDWFEITGAIFLFLGIAQVLLEMVGIPIKYIVPDEDKLKGGTKQSKLFSFPWFVSVGMIFILLSIFLPILLKFISKFFS